MSKDEQLRWERKWGPLAAVSAFVAALVPFAASIWGQSLLGTIESNRDDLFLRKVHEHGGGYVIAGVIAAVGMVFLVPVLVYLFQATRARRPLIPRIALILAVAAPLIAGGTGIARQVVLVQTADEFVKEPLKPATPAQKQKLESATNAKDRQKALDDIGYLGQAKDKVRSGSVTTVAYIGLIGSLSLAIAYVLISMNAMRAGLLSRFVGIMGVIVGALTVLPLFPGIGQVIQLFWLGAVGLLFLNRWPQGRGPAWEEVEPIPWPTAQDRRDAVAGDDDQAARPRGGRQRAPGPEPEVVETEAREHTAEAARPRPSSTHPRSKKRKRKRRG